MKPKEYHLDHILHLLDASKDHYHRLVLVSGENWQARTELLQAAADKCNMFYLSLGLPLSQALLDHPPKQRPLLVYEIVSTLLAPSSGSPIALDHIEILFDAELRTDSLRLLQTLSRQRTILASWPGDYQDNRLTYAEPAHREYAVFPINDLGIYSLEVSR